MSVNGRVRQKTAIHLHAAYAPILAIRLTAAMSQSRHCLWRSRTPGDCFGYIPCPCESVFPIRLWPVPSTVVEVYVR
jgi:hypothetical protein